MATSATTKMLYCVGKNNDGEFGDGNTASLFQLSQMEWCKHIEIQHIFSGWDFTIYSTYDNQYYSAGNNESYQCIQERNEKKQTYNSNESNKFEVGQKIVSICDATKYAATIKKVERSIFSEHRVLVTYDNCDRKDEWITSNDWYKRFVDPTYSMLTATKINKLKMNINIKSIFCNPMSNNYSCRGGCILTQNNTLYQFGQSTVPISVPFHDNVKDIQQSADKCYVLTMSGNVYESTANTSKFTNIAELVNIKKVAVGYNHVLCIDSMRRVLSFGGNFCGQLGFPKDCESQSKAEMIPYFKRLNISVVDIGCGVYHSVVIGSNGAVYKFGNNEHGAVQIATQSYGTERNHFRDRSFRDRRRRMRPIRRIRHGRHGRYTTTSSSTATDIAQVAAQQQIILQQQILYRNKYCNPEIVKGMKSDKIQVLCGIRHSAVISENNIIHLFGSNKYGECIGPNYNQFSNEPFEINTYIKINYNKYIVSIDLGNENTKLILSDTDQKSPENKVQWNSLNNKRNYSKSTSWSSDGPPPILSVPYGPPPIPSAPHGPPHIPSFQEYTFNEQKQNDLTKESINWSCSMCTFINDSSTEICLMCENPKNILSNEEVEATAMQKEMELMQQQMENSMKKEMMAIKREEMEYNNNNDDGKENISIENQLKEKLKREQMERIQIEQKLKKEQKRIEELTIKLQQKQRQENENKQNYNKEQNESNKLINLLNEWNLGQYCNVLIFENGFEEFNDWIGITMNDLDKMGFKLGHARKFKRKVNEYLMQKQPGHNQHEGV